MKPGKTIVYLAMLFCLGNGVLGTAQQIEHPNGWEVTRMGDLSEPTANATIFNLQDPPPGLYIAYNESIISRPDGYISRLSSTDTLRFAYKNISIQRNAQLRLSVSSTKLSPDAFAEFKVVDLVRNGALEWQNVLIPIDISLQKIAFIKWELVIDGDLSSDPKSMVQDSFSDKFLRYEMKDFEGFDPILKSESVVQDQYTITLNRVPYDLYLEEVYLTGEGYRVQLYDGKAVTTYEPEQETKTYKGINKTTGGQVRLTISEDFVYGFIEVGDETFYIEPAVFYDRDQNPHSMLVYSNKDVAIYPEKTCAFDENVHTEKSRVSQHQKNSPNCGIVQYAIACDYSMLVKYGSIANLINRNLGVMNNVQSNYIGWFSRNYIFEIGEQFLVTCSGCDPWSTSTNSSTLLNSFSSWGGSGFSVNHDVASLWTNRNFDGSTIGVAWRPGLCATAYKYNINEDFSTNAQQIRVLLAHELGHNFGAQHDNSGDPFIMAPSVSASTTWSSQSQTQINGHMANTSCVSNCPPLVAPQCGGRFYDTAGADLPYDNNEDYTITICPDGTTDYVSILFNFFKTVSGQDILTCYQGEDTNGTIIWSHSGLNLPPVNPVVSTHPSGCLTFRFVSNGSGTQEGWAAVVNCVDGDFCAPPSSPQVTTITENSAVLTWTELGTATSWDVELVNSGSVPTGTPTYSGVSNPHPISGLMEGTLYNYYVRSRCSSVNFSGWVGPISFITTSSGVVNDVCATAIPVTVHPLEQCPAQMVNGTTADANASISSACGGTGPFPDAWYTINTGSYNGINFKINAEQGVNLGMQLFVSCGGNSIFCAPNVTSYNTNITGFPQNTTIRVRLFTDLSLGQTGGFSLCVSGIPPAPNDVCSSAVSLIPDTTCNNVSGATILANPTGLPANCAGFDVDSPRDVWYRFDADGFHDYTVTMNMSVDGVMILYSGQCGSLVQENCADNNFGAGVEQLQAGQLDPGTYFVRVYGFEGTGSFDICVTQTESFAIASGVTNNCTGYSMQNGGGTWINIDDTGGDIIASVHLNGQTMSPAFTPTLYVTDNIRQDANGQSYVGRDIAIASTENDFPSPVTLRLFYTTAEIDALIASDDEVMSLSDINITKTSIDCQGTFTGQGEFYQQTGSGVYGNGYYIDIQVNSFSTFYAHGGMSALPVSLLSFVGTSRPEGNLIQWKVENEKQLSHYELLRSSDARSFDVLTNETSKANGHEQFQYSYLDRQPLSEGYYTLASVDLDGSRSLSQTILIKREQDIPLSIYPNPVNNRLFVSGLTLDNVTYTILDMNGRVLKTGQLDHQSGIDVQSLESGVYLLRTVIGDRQDYTRFVKMN